MQNKYYAVIDTNVIVSALISTSIESNPAKIIHAITQERIIPLYNAEIIKEYYDVLSRPKFRLDKKLITTVLNTIETDGLELDRTPSIGINFPDPKDIVFYEIALSKEESFLVTGNIKHFPSKTFVITPAEMVAMLGA
ncbi:MAG: putative toxin-antitoxin system toxin component, PIN family [Bacteroidales bacterium]|nr:putative toxin-antitoxin system toxin component, PIN family [Bacteroidales bacterium]